MRDEQLNLSLFLLLLHIFITVEIGWGLPILWVCRIVKKKVEVVFGDCRIGDLVIATKMIPGWPEWKGEM
jgi:hypothetical protein